MTLAVRLTVNAIKNRKLKAHIHNNAIAREPNLEKGRLGSICIYCQHKKKQYIFHSKALRVCHVTSIGRTVWFSFPV
jgi:hypothetical protein